MATVPLTPKRQSGARLARRAGPPLEPGSDLCHEPLEVRQTVEGGHDAVVVDIGILVDEHGAQPHRGGDRFGGGGRNDALGGQCADRPAPRADSAAPRRMSREGSTERTCVTFRDALADHAGGGAVPDGRVYR